MCFWTHIMKLKQKAFQECFILTCNYFSFLFLGQSPFTLSHVLCPKLYYIVMLLLNKIWHYLCNYFCNLRFKFFSFATIRPFCILQLHSALLTKTPCSFSIDWPMMSHLTPITDLGVHSLSCSFLGLRGSSYLLFKCLLIKQNFVQICPSLAIKNKLNFCLKDVVLRLWYDWVGMSLSVCFPPRMSVCFLQPVHFLEHCL